MQYTDLIKLQTHEPVISLIERPGAERNVLAYVINHPDSIYDVVSALEESDFNNSINQLLYKCMVMMVERGVQITIPNILGVLEGNNALDKAVEEYLRRIAQTNVGGVDLDYNIKLVKTTAIKRRAYEQGIHLLNDCVNDELLPDDASSFVGRQQQRFIDLGLTTGDRVMHIAHGLEEWLKNRSTNPNPIPGLRSGFPDLDQEIGGFQGGRAYLFAARTKNRKSILLNNFAVNVAVNEGAPILYLDTEMQTENDVRPRLLSILSGVDTEHIDTGMYSTNPESYDAVNKAARVMEKLPFYHAYIPNFTVSQVASIVRKYYIKNGIKALFFDYIKLPLSVGDGAKEYQLLGQMMAALKDLAGELNIPLIAAAQLNRKGEQLAEDGKPSDDMVGGSDRLIHNTSYLFYLWKKSEAQIAADGGEQSGNMCLHLGESRHGGDYFAWLNAHPRNARITEIMNLR